MTSYRFQINERSRQVGRMVGAAQRSLQQAFSEAKDECGFTQAELARKLEMDRSLLNRQLTGESNLTIRTLADLAWSIGRTLDVRFLKPSSEGTANEQPTEHRFSDQVVSTVTSASVVTVPSSAVGRGEWQRRTSQ